MNREINTALVSIVVATLLSVLNNIAPAAAEVDTSMQSRFDSENHAIDLYNRGISEMNKQNYSESAKWFCESLRINPRLDAAHEALGTVYHELKEYDKALLQLQTALHSGRSKTDALFIAGDSYAQTGNYKDAARCLKSYINSSHDTGYLELAQRELSILEHQCLSKPDGDYFAAASQGGICYWPASAMPLKVFINENSRAKGYTPEFARILRQAFQEWSEVSQKKVSFIFTSNVDQADIKCDWTDDVTKFGDTQELGLTSILTDEETGLISSAEISLYSFIDRGLQAPDAFLRTAKSVQLHEIGHTLGLGHSQCDYDVMYALSSPEGFEFPLNARDRNTITTLYSRLETEAMTSHKGLEPQSLLRKD